MRKHQFNSAQFSALLAAGFVLSVGAGCGNRDIEHPTITSTGVDGEHRFAIDFRGNVTLEEVEMWSSSRRVFLWSFKPRQQRQFAYGVLPADAEQTFPAVQITPRVPFEDEEVVVRVKYSYPLWHSPYCTSWVTQAFRKRADSFLPLPMKKSAALRPKWKSDQERGEFVDQIEREIAVSTPLFLKLADNPDATVAEKNLIARLKARVGLDDPTEAYTELRGIDIFASYSTEPLDLSVLGDFENITSLVVPGHDIDDIRPIANLEHLKFLRLENNRIVDLAPLRHLTDLEVLVLDNNNISDLAPLADLTKLTRLQIADNQVKDISPLKSLNKLRSLDLSGNRITSIAPLGRLHELFDVDLSNNQVASVWPLAGMLTLNKNEDREDTALPTVYPNGRIGNLGLLNISNNRVLDREPVKLLRAAKVDVTE